MRQVNESGDQPFGGYAEEWGAPFRMARLRGWDLAIPDPVKNATRAMLRSSAIRRIRDVTRLSLLVGKMSKGTNCASAPRLPTRVLGGSS